MSRIVCHFSCGAASAVATKLTLSEFNGSDLVVCYAETGSEDSDNVRFLADCEAWFSVPVVRLKNPKYKDTWDVWETRKYIAGTEGAPCTGYLKISPQLAFQRPHDIHIFGYTADSNDMRRADAFRENWPDLQVRTPLIERGINKAACLAMILSAGIEPPRTYAMGFPNANCIPCCKATSPDYWALVRREYPLEFTRMDKLSRKLEVKLSRIKGERVYVGDIPIDWPVIEAIAPECDLLCHMAEHDIANF